MKFTSLKTLNLFKDRLILHKQYVESTLKLLVNISQEVFVSLHFKNMNIPRQEKTNV